MAESGAPLRGRQEDQVIAAILLLQARRCTGERRGREVLLERGGEHWPERRLCLLARGVGPQAREHPHPPVQSLVERTPSGRELRFHHHRHKHTRGPAELHTVEALARDADNRVRMAVDDRRAADDCGVRAEAAHPVRVAQHRHRVRTGRTVVVRGERSTECGTDTERVEVRAGHQLAGEAFRASGVREVERVVETREDAIEHGLALCDLAEHRVRQLGAVSAVLAVPQAREGDLHELLGILDRERADENLIDEREHRRRGANPQPDRQDGDGCKSWSPAQNSDGVADVVPGLFQRAQTLLVAVLILDRFDGSERQDGLAPRFGRRHAGAPVLLGLPIEVRLDVFLQARFVASAARRQPQPSEKPPHGSHDRSSAFASKNRVISAIVSFQFRVSAWSCRRPAAVSR